MVLDTFELEDGVGPFQGAGVPTDLSARRPIKTRDARWVQAFARRLAQSSVTPNQISVLGLVLAGLAGLALAAQGRFSALMTICSFLVAAGGIQGRLLCNLLDGLVAVEGGKASTTGPIYNELPDRFADLMVLVGAGYGVGVDPVWGWCAGVGALMTAYVRALGASIGGGQQFQGPMSKSHRMAMLTGAALIAAGTVPWGWSARIVEVALILVTVGTAITCVRRLQRIVRNLEAA